MSEDFEFALDYQSHEPFSAYVERLKKFSYGVDLPDGYVPATFLIAVVDNIVVGRVSIRHKLNDFLAHEGGHIGYGVLAEHRRKGYATDILAHAVIVARSVGIEAALLTCADQNVYSARVIERSGGVLRDKVTASDGTTVRRYDITLFAQI